MLIRPLITADMMDDTIDDAFEDGEDESAEVMNQVGTL